MLLVASSTLGLVVVEFGLRLHQFGSFYLPAPAIGLREPHEVLGWSLRPNQRQVVRTYDYTVEVVTNSKGHRDVERDYAPAKGRRRIVVLGDSFMEAYQVERTEALPARLESKLSKTDVINLGVGGYGTTQELLMLREEGFRYEPELVIVAFFVQNDIHNNSEYLELALWTTPMMYTYGRPYVHTVDGWTIKFDPPDVKRSQKWVAAKRAIHDSKRAWERTALAERLGLSPVLIGGVERLPNFDPNINFGVYLSTYDRAARGVRVGDVYDYAYHWDNAWRVTEVLLENMHRESMEAGAELVIMLVPAKVQVDAEYRALVESAHPSLVFDFERPNGMMRDFSRLVGARLFDLLPAFRAAAAEGEPLYHHRDRHWNARGHEVATEALHAYLKTAGLVDE